MEQGTPQASLLMTRIIWLGMLGGMITFGGVVLFLAPGFSNPDAQMGRIFLFIGAGMLIAGVPAGYFIRMQIYKKNWKKDAITPGGYFTGNLLLFALIEGATLAALTGCLASQSLWPAFIPAIVGVLLMAVNFPTGRPMQPATPGPMR